MKKKLLMIVCICVISILNIVNSYAYEEKNTTEYTFDIVLANCENNPDGGYDITLRLYQHKPCTEARLVLWVYDEADKMIAVETREVYSFGDSIAIHTEKNFKNAYVSVWESGLSIKPIAKKVKMGYVSLSSYTVEYYQQNRDLSGYTMFDSKQVNNILSGEEIALSEEDLPAYENFVFDSVNSVLNGKVTPDGLTLKVYYNRIISSYTVEYYQQNRDLSGYTMFDSKQVSNILSGEEIALSEEDLPAYENFVFDEKNSGNVLSGTVTPDGLTLKVYYNVILKYPVTVEYYRQNVECNGYDLYLSDKIQDSESGTVITLDETSLPEYDGFSFDFSNDSNVLSGEVTSDGLVLKAYYNHIVDELALQEIRYRLDTKLLGTFKKISGNLTDTEAPLVKTCMDTIKKVLADADAGVLIYIEDYVSTKYRTDVEAARTQLDTLKAAGGYDDFKSKLTKYLSMADVEYLAKIMFGIDDIYQYEKEHL